MIPLERIFFVERREEWRKPRTDFGGVRGGISSERSRGEVGGATHHRHVIARICALIIIERDEIDIRGQTRGIQRSG